MISFLRDLDADQCDTKNCLKDIGHEPARHYIYVPQEPSARY